MSSSSWASLSRRLMGQWRVSACGYMYVYPSYATTERLYEVEEEARESQAGMWKLLKKVNYATASVTRRV